MFLETVESTLNVNTRPIPPCADFPINTVAGDSSLLSRCMHVKQSTTTSNLGLRHLVVLNTHCLIEMYIISSAQLFGTFLLTSRTSLNAEY